MFHQTDNRSAPGSACRFPQQQTEAELLWTCFGLDAELSVTVALMGVWMATYALFENKAYLSADQLIKSVVIWYIDMLSTAG